MCVPLRAARAWWRIHRLHAFISTNKRWSWRCHDIYEQWFINYAVSVHITLDAIYSLAFVSFHILLLCAASCSAFVDALLPFLFMEKLIGETVWISVFASSFRCFSLKKAFNVTIPRHRDRALPLPLSSIETKKLVVIFCGVIRGFWAIEIRIGELNIKWIGPPHSQLTELQFIYKVSLVTPTRSHRSSAEDTLAFASSSFLPRHFSASENIFHCWLKSFCRRTAAARKMEKVRNIFQQRVYNFNLIIAKFE